VATEEIDSFLETQRMLERMNRELDEAEERELDALDDSIVSTSRDELRRLRDSLAGEG
jgi:hypothetical protein